MNEGFHCEAKASFASVRLIETLTQRVLEECQFCVLDIMQRTRVRAVLYDLSDMQPTPIHVLLYQRVLDEHVAHLGITRAIVAPNAPVAHMARLAFSGGTYRLFHRDIEAAERFLQDAGAWSGADWDIRAIQERRLRERRSLLREPNGRRRQDHVAH
jgi:hypothetical protein